MRSSSSNSKTKRMLTINTHCGFFNVNRLQPGIKTAPGAFQELMAKMLSGTNGTSAFLDDVIVNGTDVNDHRRELFDVLSRMQDYGFKLRIEKCQFGQTGILFCGHIIDSQGIRPDSKKIKSILDISQPTDVSQLRSILGAINYYGKFVKSMKELRGPLDKLLKKDTKFVWKSEHEAAFN